MIRAYHQPKALKQALALVAKGATPVAGATAVYTAKSEREQTLVDITRLGLDTIDVKASKVTLGATVTLSQIADDTRLPGMVGAVLRQGARALVSRPLRNAVTLGGNIAHPCFWADMPVVLLTLKASLEIQKAGQKTKIIPIAKALADKKRAWDKGLITRVMIPLDKPTVGWGYERFARTTNDYAFVTACATLRREGAIARDVRLVLGALQLRPFVVTLAAELCEGQEFTGHLLDAVGLEIAKSVRAAPNFRASAEYRQHLAGVLAKRALATAFAWAMREDA